MGFYKYNSVMFKDFGVSSLSHDFQLHTLSYIPIDTRSPLSSRERGLLAMYFSSFPANEILSASISPILVM